VARACAVFDLTAFERDVVLLALAVEVDAACSTACAELLGEPSRRPTVGLALRLFAGEPGPVRDAAFAALAPGGHLDRAGVLELDGDGPHASRQLRIAADLWPRLVDAAVAAAPLLFPATGAAALDRLVLAPATRARAEAAMAWAAPRRRAAPVLAVIGAAGSGRDALAAALATALGHRVLTVDGRGLGAADARRAVVRESAWSDAVPVISPGATGDAVALLAAELPRPLLVIADAADRAARPPGGWFEIEIGELDAEGRARLWRQLLATTAVDPSLDLDGLAARFRLGPGRIARAIADAGRSAAARSGAAITAAELSAAVHAGVTAPRGLARRLDCPYTRDDMVLVPATRRELDLVLAWARHGAGIFRPGGAGARIRGREGFTCLFAGQPGTGKTMAAQILARELMLELHRVDLSQVVDKYIGETEKNLETVFSDAESAGAVLFFDEADALFGKRTDVKDAHARYANLETAFLLQRLESHRGLVVLATNLAKNLDDAFLRRIDVVADFPMPGAAERVQIWERHLVREHLAADVDLGLLATRFAIAGGDIRNAVIAALLLAADDGGAVAMRHLVIGLWRELNKAGRLVSPGEFGAWSQHVLTYVRAGQTR
jgi:hypothetical protein